MEDCTVQSTPAGWAGKPPSISRRRRRHRNFGRKEGRQTRHDIRPSGAEVLME